MTWEAGQTGVTGRKKDFRDVLAAHFLAEYSVLVEANELVHEMRREVLWGTIFPRDRVSITYIDTAVVQTLPAELKAMGEKQLFFDCEGFEGNTMRLFNFATTPGPIRTVFIVDIHNKPPPGWLVQFLDGRTLIGFNTAYDAKALKAFDSNIKIDDIGRGTKCSLKDYFGYVTKQRARDVYVGLDFEMDVDWKATDAHAYAAADVWAVAKIHQEMHTIRAGPPPEGLEEVEARCSSYQEQFDSPQHSS